MMRLVLALLVLGSIAGCARDDGPAPSAPGEGEQPASPADSNRLAALRADAGIGNFDLAVQPRVFEFPGDHGPHPTFRHEWWYVTGHLDASTGEPFGFELTFFRFALKPPQDLRDAAQAVSRPGKEGDAAASPSAWRARQIYMAHFAVTDIQRGEFHVAERFARDALGLAGAQAEPFRVSLDDWSLGSAEESRTPTPPASSRDVEPLSASQSGDATSSAWHLVAADRGYSLDLELRPASPIVLNGDAGLSRKAAAEGAASYYYSIPRMTAKGRLVRDGEPLDVQGAVWLDREWGSGSLGTDQQGWDWFALQLDDGSALMFYALRARDGQRDPHSAGTWLAPNGTTRSLASNEVQIDTKREWTSPRGGRYPARWQLRVPSLNLDVDVEPRLADQELNTSTRYWEGASTVRGTREGKPITGKAYVELVGYAAQ